MAFQAPYRSQEATYSRGVTTFPGNLLSLAPDQDEGKVMAVAHGFPDYPFAIIPHPINAASCEVRGGFPAEGGTIVVENDATIVDKSKAILIY